MEIRAITLFITPESDPAQYAPFIAAARDAFPMPVQTMRLATTPFPEWLPYGKDGTRELVRLEQAWKAAGIDFMSVGTALIAHDVEWLSEIPFYLGATESVFASAEIADVHGYIDFDRISFAARIIQQLSLSQANGFDNLFFAATAHCGRDYPFFPVACGSGEIGFAIAMEGVTEVRQALQTAVTLNDARSIIINQIETTAKTVSATADYLATQFDVPFRGIDFSMAPFPVDEKSLGGALQDVGLPFIGTEGSLFAAAFLTDALQRAQFPRAGYNGLMMSVLEDSVLAKHVEENRLSVNDLLMYSAVCGVGLDTLPLPGNVTTDQLKAILMDTAALALRLRKPLTARLMPIPGKMAGEPVVFDFPYFANSRVMRIRGSGMSHPRFKYMSMMTLNEIERP